MNRTKTGRRILAVLTAAVLTADLVAAAIVLRADRAGPSVEVVEASSSGLPAIIPSGGGADEPDPDPVVRGGVGTPLAPGPPRKPRVDFNSDGYGDAVVPVPGEDLRRGQRRVGNAGAVVVIPGSSAGLVTRSAIQLTLEDVRGEEIAQADDRFGMHLASGDLDGDGYSDLAVGVPGHDDRRGVVAVFFGSAGGLTTDGSMLLRQGSQLSDAPEEWDQFGWWLEIGRFDTDLPGNQLVIFAGGEETSDGEGSPSDDQDRLHGIIHVVWGFGGTLKDRVIQPGEAGLPEHAAYDSNLLCHHASGHFDDEPGTELVVGVMVGDYGECRLYMMFGGPNGPARGVAVIERCTFEECLETLSDTPAIGRDRGGRGFLAVSPLTPGTILVIPPDERGRPDFDARIAVDQRTEGVPGRMAREDRFGSALGLGDMDGDGVVDLIVGDDRELQGHGAAFILRRTGRGSIARRGNVRITQDSPGVPGHGEEGDAFGRFISVDDFDGDDILDLLVTAQWETIGNVRPGVVTVIYGGETSNSQLHQDVPGIPDKNEARDWFGGSFS